MKYALLALPGGCLMLGLVLLVQIIQRRRHARERALIEALIAERGLLQRFVGLDDELRQRTAKRREIADRTRNRAAKVESGSPVSDLLRVVK